MDQRLHEVRQNIDETRAAMTEKFEMLEGRVREAVEDTKSTVKRSVDPNHHMQQHPWVMVGLAVLAGCILKRATTSHPPTTEQENGRIFVIDSSDESSAHNWANQFAAGQQPQRVAEPPQNNGAHGGFFAQYQDELSMIKGAAVGAVVTVVRDLVRQAVPAITPYVQRASDKLTGRHAKEPDISTRQRSSTIQQYSGVLE